MNVENGPDLASEIDRCIRMLKAGNAEEIYEAADTLGNIGPAAMAAVPALVRTLRITGVRAHDAWYEQWDSGPMGQAEMAAHEAQFAYDCRIYAAQALGKIGPAARRAIPPLVKAILEDDGYSDWGTSVSETGSASLVQIGPEAIPELVKALGSSQLRESKRDTILEALAQYGAAGLPFFLKILKNKDLSAEARRHAIDLVERMADEKVPTQSEAKGLGDRLNDEHPAG